jgi:hypothetical protein
MFQPNPKEDIADSLVLTHPVLTGLFVKDM